MKLECLHAPVHTMHALEPWHVHGFFLSKTGMYHPHAKLEKKQKTQRMNKWNQNNDKKRHMLVAMRRIRCDQMK